MLQLFPFTYFCLHSRSFIFFRSNWLCFITILTESFVDSPPVAIVSLLRHHELRVIDTVALINGTLRAILDEIALEFPIAQIITPPFSASKYLGAGPQFTILKDVDALWLSILAVQVDVVGQWGGSLPRSIATSYWCVEATSDAASLSPRELWPTISILPAMPPLSLSLCK